MSSKGKVGESKVLYRIRHESGLYYSPRSTGRAWNKAGKFLTKQQLGQVLGAMPNVRMGARPPFVEEWVCTRIR